MKFKFAAWACLCSLSFMSAAFVSKVTIFFILPTLMSPIFSLVSIQILLATWKFGKLSETPAKIFLGLLFLLGGVVAAFNIDGGILISRPWLAVPCYLIVACLANWVVSQIMGRAGGRLYEIYFVLHAVIIALSHFLLFTSQE
jgi:hypothetical protein